MAAESLKTETPLVKENDHSASPEVSTKINAPRIHSDAMSWIEEQIASDASPRDILHQMLPRLTIPDHVDDMSLWILVFEIVTEPSPRERLPTVTSIRHVTKLIKECKNIIVLTGAGVSVSCGIPDFRSRDGIYARLSKDYPDLPNPQAMFDIHYFRSNPWPFFKFAKEIYPGQFTPSLCHRFISYLNKTGRLLRNYTQNIDTLEQIAGIKNVVQCHGSFATATCMNCKHQVKSEEIKGDIFNEKIPYCKQCNVTSEPKTNILKPDIVFFGESLPETFHKKIEEDKEKADLLIVIGSSLNVRPVSLIPSLVNSDIPQILINRESLNLQFDVEFYGNCDDIIFELCEQLGEDWKSVNGSYVPKPLDEHKIKNIISEIKGENSIDDSIDSTDESNVDVKVNDDDERATECLSCNGNKDIDSANKNNSNESNVTLKRKCSCGEEVARKRKKVEWNESVHSANRTSNDDVYYLSVSPRRYIFCGAEVDPDCDSDLENSEEEGGDTTCKSDTSKVRDKMFGRGQKERV